MVVHRYGKDALGTALPNDVVIKDIADFQRRRHATILLADKAALGFFPDDIVAQFNAFIADEDGWPCDQLAHLMLRLPAEAAVQGAFRIRARQFRHFTFPVPGALTHTYWASLPCLGMLARNSHDRTTFLKVNR